MDNDHNVSNAPETSLNHVMLLAEVSQTLKIKENSIRYHMRKLPEIFQHIPRDRYNRFLFVKNDLEIIKNVHSLKKRGLKYPEIREELLHVEQRKPMIEDQVHSLSATPLVSEVSRNSQHSTNNLHSEQYKQLIQQQRTLQERLAKTQEKQDKLQKINELLYEKNIALSKEVEDLKTELSNALQSIRSIEENHNSRQTEIDSLEERVALLVDIHTKMMLEN